MVDSHVSPPTRTSRRRPGICTGVHIPASGGPTVPRRRVRVAFRSCPPETPYEWQPNSVGGSRIETNVFRRKPLTAKDLLWFIPSIRLTAACGIRRNPWPCYPESARDYPASRPDLGRRGFRLIIVLLPEHDRLMSPGLVYEPLSLTHADELAALLLNAKVYRYLGGSPPSFERFRAGIERALSGPPADRANEHWINYVVRDSVGGRIVGRLEATIHSQVAEVAFLFGPAYWGKGYAMRGLLWLHDQLRSRYKKSELWATTVPANERCQALLIRCGYSLVDKASAPYLFSYDPGDLVFRGPPAAEQRNAADSRRSGA